jgi:hypothetical protein
MSAYDNSTDAAAAKFSSRDSLADTGRDYVAVYEQFCTACSRTLQRRPRDHDNQVTFVLHLQHER